MEYCHFGNLHNYLLRHRGDFIDQIDPTTGKLDINIGQDILSETNNYDDVNRYVLFFNKYKFSNILNCELTYIRLIWLLLFLIENNICEKKVYKNH